MKKEQSLMRDLTDMVKETKSGRLKWKVICQTTEYNETTTKPTVIEDNITWVVDECYVSYECEYKGKTFLMITYEMIHSAEDKKKTTNLVFLPPLGIRYFDINVLLPYAIEADNILTFEIHQLWMLLIDMYKKDSSSVDLDVSPRELVIE